MAEPKVWVFFYGSFINRQVLARGGLMPERVEIAWLWGFDILIETLATLIRSDRHCVYGIVCQATSGRKWNEFLRNELFVPLSMKSTVVDSSELRGLDNVAAPHAT